MGSFGNAQNDLKLNVDFDLILTPKRVILTPILGFQAQITKITPKMDYLTQKTYPYMGHI